MKYQGRYTDCCIKNIRTHERNKNIMEEIPSCPSFEIYAEGPYSLELHAPLLKVQNI
jgi:hypothetical protein